MKKIAALALLALIQAVPLHAAVLSGNIAANATIRPTGPTSTQHFFTMESSDFGTFASFGVLDFSIVGASLGPNEIISSVSSISLSLSQSNASFSASGTLAFYLTTDTTTAFSSLAFDSGGGVGGLGSQLAPNYLLGTGSYIEGTTGQTDVFQLNVPTTAESYLANLLSTGGTLRLIVLANSAGTAATYAGIGNFNAAAPALSVTYDVDIVPEPTTAGLLGGIGLASLLLRRRRSAQETC
jgi:hypothetical protein